jgi:GTP:adenosylcobinamide-phosphate guanylyltransferase
MSWTAVVLAGSRPGRDAFAEQFGTDLKALIPVGGEPMVRRPVRALLESGQIGQVLVMAQEPERIADALADDPRISVRRSGGTIAETMLTLIGDASVEWPLVVTTADHALLDAATIRGGAYTGANLFALRSRQVAPAVELWRSVEQDRKKAWRVMSILGPLMLASVALRLVSLDEVLGQIGGKLNLSVKAIRLSNPLAGVDVDKAEDHALVEAILGRRA